MTAAAAPTNTAAAPPSPHLAERAAVLTPATARRARSANSPSPHDALPLTQLSDSSPARSSATRPSSRSSDHQADHRPGVGLRARDRRTSVRGRLLRPPLRARPQRPLVLLPARPVAVALSQKEGRRRRAAVARRAEARPRRLRGRARRSFEGPHRPRPIEGDARRADGAHLQAQRDRRARGLRFIGRRPLHVRAPRQALLARGRGQAPPLRQKFEKVPLRVGAPRKTKGRLLRVAPTATRRGRRQDSPFDVRHLHAREARVGGRAVLLPGPS